MTLICKRLINSNDMNTQHTHPYKTPFNVGSLEYGVSEHPAPPHPSYQTAPPRKRREGGGSLFGGGGREEGGWSHFRLCDSSCESSCNLPLTCFKTNI